MNYKPAPFFNVIAKSDLSKRIWSSLNSSTVIQSLIDKAKDARPSVEAVDSLIDSKFSNEIDSLGKSISDQYKKMIGHMIGQIMIENGYRKVDTKELMNCVYFTKGYWFKKVN